MWSRKDLKSRAKMVLQSSYWKAMAAALVLMISGGWRGSRIDLNFIFNENDRRQWGQIDRWLTGDFIHRFMPIIIYGAIMAMVIAIAYRIFLGFQLEVGAQRFYVKAAQNDVNMSNLSFAFKKGVYLDIIETMIVRGVLNFLWYLLFIIPGIIKYYAYSMVPYILTENPGIGHKRAIELSRKMTDGHKFDIFVLELSFLGWYLLGLLACVVGMLFVMPYENATKAELYLVLREKAIYNGLCSEQELTPEAAPNPDPYGY